MRVKDAVGRHGEELAVAYVREAGMAVLARNWRCRDGELDIIARDGDVLVFVEVKTRSSSRYGDPAEAISRQKAARIRRLALQWLSESHAGFAPDLRFDVISVLRPPRVASTSPTEATGWAVRHLKGAF